jgi:2-polyprenyl-6-hydroxyphenyl methylase/3-demethylubiquinone-9 3-methyltransferase
MNNEVSKFDDIAYAWWDINGPFKSLHDINPLRMQFLKQNCDFNDKKVLDVGCGGGILAESLARQGAQVTGLDLGLQNIEIAKLHSLESGLTINYKVEKIEDIAKTHHKFDVITCLEVLEHAENLQSILASCSHLLKKDGILFLSTINRTAKAYLEIVLAAEYILQLLPKNTHNYAKFIKPSELRAELEACGFELINASGFSYNIITKSYFLTDSLDVNYLFCARKL